MTYRAQRLNLQVPEGHDTVCIRYCTFPVVGRLTKKQRQEITVPSYTAQAIIGLLLGDGWMTKSSPTGNARFGFAQSTIHKLYFDKVFSLFTSLCTPNLVPLMKTFGSMSTTTMYSSLSFITMRLPALNLYYDLFYKLTSTGSYVKIVPMNIGELLTEVGLAYWIMDDGSRHNNGLHLNVYNFNSASVQLLLNVLGNKYNLKCSLHAHSAHGGKVRIYIFEESMLQLRSLVSPHMVPSMLYKIGQ